MIKLSKARGAAMASLAVVVPVLAISLGGVATAATPIVAKTDPARAAQIYDCDAATRTYKFARPVATLRTADGTTIDHGAGPSGTAPDGSRITGTVVSKKPRVVPDIPTVPELVLKAQNNSAPGSFFAGVTTIRRIETIGGAGSYSISSLPVGAACFAR